jgi:RNA polymerase sigma-70 factor (ECF subfamily)
MSQGLEAVFLACRTKLVGFLRLRGAGEAAEDLVQEVWIKVAARPPGPIGNTEAYLFRTAHNVMLDWHRSDRQRQHREKAWTEDRSNGDLEADPEPDAEQAMVARSTLALVQARIADLGEPGASIFRLFRIEQVPQREIAARFGVSLATVEKHLQKAYRAMAELRGRIGTD